MKNKFRRTVRFRFIRDTSAAWLPLYAPALYCFAVSKAERVLFKSRGRILNGVLRALYYCVMYIAIVDDAGRLRNPITFLIFSPKPNHHRHHRRATTTTAAAAHS